MSSVTKIKFVLTQKGLQIFCETFHIPDDVHPQLPSPNQTIHEMPTGKIAAKVSHFEILWCVHGVEPTVGLFHCFYVNSKNKGWMSFSKRPDNDAHTGKNVFRDTFPKSRKFRADDYAVLLLIRLRSGNSSHHSSTNASGAEGDFIIRSVVVSPVMTEAVITTHVASIPSAPAPEPSTKVITLVHASMFHDSDSTGTVRPDAASSSHVPGKELSMGSREVDSESLHDVFIPSWNIPNDALLDNLDASREFIDHLAPSVLFAQIRDMDYEELFTEFSVGTARQACLSAKVRMRTEYCLSERRRLEFEFEKQGDLLKAKDDEVEGLKARLLLKEAEAAEAIRLRAEVSNFEVTENSLQDETNTLKERNAFLENERNALDAKMTDLEASVVAKERALTDLNSLITSVKSQNDILLDRVRAPIFRRRSRCMRIAWSTLRDQDDRMKVVNDKFDQLYTDFLEMALHLEERFYPHLLTTISCRSKAIEKGIQDGLSAGITHGKEENLGENIANQRSALRDVFVPLAEPFSTAALTGTKSTSDIISAAANTTMALSTTLASGSTVPPITIEDYEVMGTDVPSPLHSLAWERCLHFIHIEFLEVADVPCSLKGVPVRPLSFYAHLPSAFVTSYGPSYLVLTLPPSSAWRASLLRSRLISKASSFFIMSTSAVLQVGMPISTGTTAFVLPLACGCFTKAKRWRIRSFSHQSLNGLSLNCFSLSDIISPVNVMFFQLKAPFEKSSCDFWVRQYLLYGLVRDYNDCVCLEIPFQPFASTH
nr:hypothetical protein [Tanacetum cinerariifolium]